ncbi:MAG: allophanate hydrolase [Gammaproteobacteria bacterium]|nr:MAG: allophanate hydrolase [Gammaproteobacteria bacterium]
MGEMQVISIGFLATVQDQGRYLCQHLGLAEAGALDKHALFWGNRLVGNKPDSPAVEILLGNSAFTFDSATRIAISGAAMPVTLNDTPVPGWTAIPIQPGDVIKCGIAPSGLRAYLTIAGGFTVPRFFNSGSTVIREQTGANQGKKLTAGDTLSYRKQADQTCQNAVTLWPKTPRHYIPDYNAPLTLHFFPGYHYREFDPNSVQRCLNNWYTIAQDSDRMGYRLSGTPLTREGADILSIGVPCGAIQIPTAGEPIILLNDRQCTGGYPILGVVCARDLFRLAQKRPGEQVRFAIADIDQQQRRLHTFYQFFATNTINLARFADDVKQSKVYRLTNDQQTTLAPPAQATTHPPSHPPSAANLPPYPHPSSSRYN